MRRVRPPSQWRSFFAEPWLVYTAAVFVFLAWFFLSWPISAYDTDLWYHLNGGRYIITHHAIPTDSFFSFVSPPRPFVDYYWLFQVLVFTIFSGWGYQGLVILRALVYLATVALMFRFLLKDLRNRDVLPWLLFVGVCGSMVLLVRHLLIRPHIFTDLFIITFLFILEMRPRNAIVLPLLGIVWCNMHGIVYPVMILIVGAYFLEGLADRLFRHTRAPHTTLAFLVPVGCTLATVLLTPHGVGLLRIPFIPSAGASQYIRELIPLSLFDALSFSISCLAPTGQTFFNVVMLAAGIAGVVSCSKRPFRLSHLVLGIGAFALLTRGVRFTIDFVLLTLPLLRANPLLPTTHLARRAPKIAYLAVTALMLIMPLRFIRDIFADRPAYPFSRESLPIGSIEFLHHVNVGGTVLNFPDPGGYLQWALYPTYRIFSDMQVPFLFTDKDMYLAIHMFHDQDALDKVLSTYHPSFIMVPTSDDKFPELIKKFPEYRLVFYDDVGALYLDGHQHPALAQQYELKAMDPFALATQGLEEYLKKQSDKDALVHDAQKVLEVYPGCRLAHLLVAMVYNENGAYDRALPHAETIIRLFPDRPMAYRIKGDSLAGLRSFERAIEAYQSAIPRSNPSDRSKLYQKIGNSYFELHQYPTAYRILSQNVKLFSQDTTRDALYTLGSAARLTGHSQEAEQIFRYLYDYRINSNNKEWVEKLTRELTTLGAHLDRQ